jgi:threonine dehydratase
MGLTGIGPREVEAAAARIAGRVRETPVMTLELGALGEGDVTLKLELVQHTGSFKARGAFNRVLGEGPLPAAGVVAASGGNHGAAAAYVARSLGLRARIFVPAASPPAKRERIASYGAEVLVAGEVYDDAQAAADAEARRTGALLVHPYDHPLTVAGAGTLARELDRQAPGLDTVLVAVGGGGLLGGTAAWFQDRVRVVSVEPASIPAMHDSLAAGHQVEVTVQGLAADSLGAKRIGDVPWTTASAWVHDAVLVTDDEIRAAQRWLWSTCRVMAEPGGAAAVAALLAGAYSPAAGERAAAVVCGANTDPASVA